MSFYINHHTKYISNQGLEQEESVRVNTNILELLEAQQIL